MEITVTKPRRGDCGSCHWFELAEQQQNGGRIGHCMVNPPIPAPGMQQNPITNQVRQVLQGIRPPVNETDRCEKWRAFGASTSAQQTVRGGMMIGGDDAA